jgi:pimeloyl-ACP methyl ester carboxylesterase
MKEKVLRIGKPVPLNGVFSMPNTEERADLCVLILNSGLMHHVGTSRASVELARSLAQNDICAFRFDLSGIGDSPARRGGSSFTENASNEVQEVMDDLQARYGLKRFILYGLCSGADVSFRVAQIDKRVEGIAQIDPYVYRNLRWYIFHFGRRFFKVGPWKTAISSLLGRQKSKESDDLNAFVETADESREVPPKEEVVSGYKCIASRGCKVLAILTGGQLYTLNHPQQFRDLFREVDWSGGLEVKFLPNVEHILPEPAGRREIIGSIVSWAVGFGKT